ncbi:unnamed protein product [Candidula unifasciata]|uniref:DNA polymerase eta n=1 Tax=Candidula unifasciata TaxID=100452 RepID=A0A8S3Z2B4_9EUPU|nr:unnamed protein product [Candidula unifasciata]
MTDREVVLIDMDCFYVQVEQRLDPSLKGKPCAVVQYKTYRGGGIIAVGYEARALGVTRNMCGDEAQEKCPDIQLARVPEVRGKADLTRYREAGAEVITVFSKFCSCVERASVDEAFLDLTDEVSRRLKALGDSQVLAGQIANTFVEGYASLEGTSEWLMKLYSNKEANESECRLAVAASMVEEMRAAVLKETGFTCSAGISNNKMLAKFACGRNKPNKQTVLPMSAVQTLFETLPIHKIRHLGGKLGTFLTDELGLKNMWDLTKFSEQELQKHCGVKTGSWLYGACRGIETESVATRVLPKSIGCSKNFRGKEILDTKEKVKFWVSELSEEMSERLNRDKELHKRTAKSLTVSVYYKSASGPVSASRACALVRYDAEKISSDAYYILQQFNTSSSHSQQWVPPLMNLGLSASKFTDCGNHQTINSMFHSVPSTQATISSTKQSQSVPSASSTQRFPAVTDKHTETLLSSEDVDLLSNSDKIGGTDQERAVDSSTGHTQHLSNLPAPGLKCVTEITSKKHSNTESSKSSEVDGATGKQRNIQSFFSQVKMAEASNGDNNKGDTSHCLDQTGSKLLEVNTDTEISETDTKGRASGGFFAKKLKDFNQLKSTSSLTKNEPAAPSTVLASAHEADSFSDGSEAIEAEDLHDMDADHTHCSSNVSMNVDDFMECDKCGELIPIWEMPEHSDFHFALELQKETNDASSAAAFSGRSMTSTATKATSLPAIKRKSSSPSNAKKGGKKKKVDKSVQPLTVFFSKT